ncbi:hypothetical protein B6D18_08115 [Gilliamella sp. A7]|nr:hypothetical protein B6D18_08115 [Gilliamella sp. A7]
MPPKSKNIELLQNLIIDFDSIIFLIIFSQFTHYTIYDAPFVASYVILLALFQQPLAKSRIRH